MGLRNSDLKKNKILLGPSLAFSHLVRIFVTHPLAFFVRPRHYPLNVNSLVKPILRCILLYGCSWQSALLATAAPKDTSFYSGSLVLTEVLADPAHLPDHQGEYLELITLDTLPCAQIKLNKQNWILPPLGSWRALLLCRDSLAQSALGINCQINLAGLELSNSRPDTLFLSTPKLPSACSLGGPPQVQLTGSANWITDTLVLPLPESGKAHEWNLIFASPFTSSATKTNPTWNSYQVPKTIGFVSLRPSVFGFPGTPGLFPQVILPQEEKTKLLSAQLIDSQNLEICGEGLEKNSSVCFGLDIEFDLQADLNLGCYTPIYDAGSITPAASAPQKNKATPCFHWSLPQIIPGWKPGHPAVGLLASIQAKEPTQKEFLPSSFLPPSVKVFIPNDTSFIYISTKKEIYINELCPQGDSLIPAWVEIKSTRDQALSIQALSVQRRLDSIPTSSLLLSENLPKSNELSNTSKLGHQELLIFSSSRETQEWNLKYKAHPLPSFPALKKTRDTLFLTLYNFPLDTFAYKSLGKEGPASPCYGRNEGKGNTFPLAQSKTLQPNAHTWSLATPGASESKDFSFSVSSKRIYPQTTPPWTLSLNSPPDLPYKVYIYDDAGVLIHKICEPCRGPLTWQWDNRTSTGKEIFTGPVILVLDHPHKKIKKPLYILP